MKIDPVNLGRKAISNLFFDAHTPRPVTLISTVGEDGTLNIAPHSWVMPVIVQQPLYLVGASTSRDGKEKDTLTNIRYSRDFVISFVY